MVLTDDNAFESLASTSGVMLHVGALLMPLL